MPRRSKGNQAKQVFRQFATNLVGALAQAKPGNRNTAGQDKAQPR